MGDGPLTVGLTLGFTDLGRCRAGTADRRAVFEYRQLFFRQRRVSKYIDGHVGQWHYVFGLFIWRW